MKNVWRPAAASSSPHLNLGSGLRTTDVTLPVALARTAMDCSPGFLPEFLLDVIPGRFRRHLGAACRRPAASGIGRERGADSDRDHGEAGHAHLSNPALDRAPTDRFEAYPAWWLAHCLFEHVAKASFFYFTHCFSRSGRPARPSVGAQPGQCLRHRAFDRADGAAEHLRRLHLGQVVEHAQHDAPPAADWSATRVPRAPRPARPPQPQGRRGPARRAFPSPCARLAICGGSS